MEWLKKLDFKSIAILVLGIALIVSFILGQRNNVNLKKDLINELHKENEAIIKKNDSLIQVNQRIDQEIKDIQIKLAENTVQLATNQQQIKDLKKKQNEIPTYVSRLSANDVAKSLSNYLTKSSSTR
jgi:uncharacterized protein HemX